MTPTAVQEQIKKHFKFLAAGQSKPTSENDPAAAGLKDAVMLEKEIPRKESKAKKRLDPR